MDKQQVQENDQEKKVHLNKMGLPSRAPVNPIEEGQKKEAEIK